jgi:hypothetical protein
MKPSPRQYRLRHSAREVALCAAPRLCWTTNALSPKHWPYSLWPSSKSLTELPAAKMRCVCFASGAVKRSTSRRFIFDLRRFYRVKFSVYQEADEDFGTASLPLARAWSCRRDLRFINCPNTSSRAARPPVAVIAAMKK